MGKWKVEMMGKWKAFKGREERHLKLSRKVKGSGE